MTREYQDKLSLYFDYRFVHTEAVLVTVMASRDEAKANPNGRKPRK